MYNSLQLAKKYIQYYITASNGKGHGIHSPFVFDFIKNVLRDKRKYDCYHEIESRRKFLIHDRSIIEVEDLGAGSACINTRKRSVAAIARTSLKPKKYAQLLFRIVQYYHPENIIELGTSLGITTAYLAAGNTKAKVVTCEGVLPVATIAGKGFQALGLKNIELVEGDFAHTLPLVLSHLNKVDLAFIDGNHRKEPTLQYFDQFISLSGSSSIFIFDDIHWSREMEEAWENLRKHPSVTLSVDLFFIGLVFFNPDIKIQQHFAIRF